MPPGTITVTAAAAERARRPEDLGSMSGLLRPYRSKIFWRSPDAPGFLLLSANGALPAEDRLSDVNACAHPHPRHRNSDERRQVTTPPFG
jgi:hypothetical protein